MNLIYPNEEIKKYLPEIIKAYIDYFGIEHQSVIEAKFKNMEFVSYTNPDVLKKYYEENKEKEDLDYIKDYVLLCQKENKNIQLEENKSLLKNESIVGSRMLEDSIISSSNSTEPNGGGLCWFLNKENTLTLVPAVYLQNICLYYNYRDRSLLHEINHCIEISPKLYDDKMVLTSGLEQRTFDIYNENGRINVKYSDNNFYTSFEERQLTEFLNDRISYEIYLRLKKKGINILDNNRDIEATKKWIRHVNELEKFFKDYEETIKLSRLYGNINILLDKVGVSTKDELMEFLYTKYGVESIFNGDRIASFKSKQK